MQILAPAIAPVALSDSALAICCSLDVLNLQSQVVVDLGLQIGDGSILAMSSVAVNVYSAISSDPLTHVLVWIPFVSSISPCHAMSICPAASVPCANSCTCQAHVAQCAQHAGVLNTRRREWS